MAEQRDAIRCNEQWAMSGETKKAQGGSLRLKALFTCPSLRCLRS